VQMRGLARRGTPALRVRARRHQGHDRGPVPVTLGHEPARRAGPERLGHGHQYARGTLFRARESFYWHTPD